MMSRKVTPYKESDLGKKDQVRSMFNTISKEYDRLNRIITLGIDVSWRKKVVRLVKANRPESVLDVATGTGDLALLLNKSGASKIIGLDIAEAMLEVGRRKVTDNGLEDSIEMVLGDSEALPFEEGAFDAATVAFGVRNFEDLEKGLSEIYRVLRPGGIFVILETSVPTRFPFRQGYNFYTRKILPVIGRIFSRDKSAYTYLSNSAQAFPHGQAFNNILAKIGFIDIENKPQTFGVASIYVAKK
jgi:demethylmenaquinone methyltransferase/2-methoxy-6-polyprenyl-1,4-benzoquinol methylase